MAKLSKEVIQEIKDRRAKGERFVNISSALNLPLSTINYHLNPNYKKYKQEYEKNKSKNRKRVLTDEQKERIKEYSKNYFKKRYNQDPNFRKKHIARVMRNQDVKNES